ncbi:MAG: 2-oxoglutarate dehydrogenase E1 component [Acidobacteriota bacterium]
MDREDAGLGIANLAHAEAMLAAYRRDPTAVPEDWRRLFDQEEGRGVGEGPSFAAGTLFRPASAAGASAAAPSAASPRRTSLPPLPDGGGPQVASRVPALQQVPLLSRLSPPELERVAVAAEEVKLSAGHALLRTGDPGDSLYVVVEGRLRIERGGQVLARCGPGQVVGELSVMDRLPRSADAVAETDVAALQVHADTVEALVEENGSIARALFEVVTGRLRESNVRQERVDQLVRAYRVRGHGIAQVDPLGSERPSHPELQLSHHGLIEDDLTKRFSLDSGAGPVQATLEEILKRLRNTYCRHIGIQYMHVDDLEVQRWLQLRMEGTENRLELSPTKQERILTKLTEAELFETFVHAKFLGKKRFSLEGGESLIPLLEQAIEEAAELGVEKVVIGMAHRGRLNVLANIMGKTPEKIFAEFADIDPESQVGRGDVKYHMGFSSERVTARGKKVRLSLAFNPSHLEFVGPVVQGRVRGKQERYLDQDRDRVMGLVIHGDAAFAGQGVVQESLNLSELPGYRSGGTVHVIINNQVGFTTPPESSRSCTYATDVARMLEIPIFHVNGEHPDAVAQVIHLALEFRDTFRRDVIIDMYCYRRHGHNEGDEPRFTQPEMYRLVDAKPSVRESYLENLLALGHVTRERAEEIEAEVRQRLEVELEKAKAVEHRAPDDQLRVNWVGYHGGEASTWEEVDTALPRERLASLLEAASRAPEDFKLLRQLNRVLKQRHAMAAGEQDFDWGGAEILAYASLVTEGHPVRLSGQDSGRGTFSHRHAVLRDQVTGRTHAPLAHLEEGQALFDVRDSPLSETAVLAFEFGYSLEWPEALVIWEAQFGDFANGAQVIIDQFLTSAEDKWSRLSGLVLFLPHGFEGQGPEHSSARLERFLMLSAQDNIQVANLTTPAQLFHGLRRQVKRKVRKPLVLMTPKSLLRHPLARSTWSDLSEGRFQPVLADPEAPPAEEVKRVALCSGKVFYDLFEARRERGVQGLVLLRLEQIYPLPEAELEAALKPWPESAELTWVQEEPVNMGAWTHLSSRLPGAELAGRTMRVVSRPESASPATGSPGSHAIEQERLIEELFAGLPVREPATESQS